MDVEISMKGQMFILAAVFMIVLVVLIKNSADTYSIAEEGRFQQANLLGERIDNAAREARHAAGTAALTGSPSQKGMEYLSDLALMLKNDMNAETLFVYVFFNGTSQKYSVITENYMEEGINVALGATNSLPASSSSAVADGSVFVQQFNSTSNGTAVFSISYLGKGGPELERFNITLDKRNSVYLFSDISAKSNSIEIRRKDFYTWSW